MHRAKCGKCEKIVTSRYNHDYQTCGCPQATMVDGGPNRAYGRYGGADLNLVLVEDVPGSNEWRSLMTHKVNNVQR